MPGLRAFSSIAPLWVHLVPQSSDAKLFHSGSEARGAHTTALLTAARKELGKKWSPGWLGVRTSPSCQSVNELRATSLFTHRLLRASLERSQLNKLYLLDTRLKKRKEKKLHSGISGVAIWTAGFIPSAGFKNLRGCFGAQPVRAQRVPLPTASPVSSVKEGDKHVDSTKYTCGTIIPVTGKASVLRLSRKHQNARTERVEKREKKKRRFLL